VTGDAGRAHDARAGTARAAVCGLALWLLAATGALGEIHFPTSAGPEAQAHFVRGVLLLHSFEYADARVYAEVAPAAAHAQHMPSHIWLPLGRWDDVVAANEAAWAAAEARRQRKHLGVEARDHHALEWLAHGYLQQGRREDAARALRTMARDAKASGSAWLRTGLVYIRAMYLVETRQWDGFAAGVEVATGDLDLATRATDLYVRGRSALAAGRRADAVRLLAELEQARATFAAGPTWWSEALDAQTAAILARELAALVRLDAGAPERALALLGEAARHHDAMEFVYGPPWPVKPPWELLGEVLLRLERFEEAAQAFRRALERAPGRTLSATLRERALARSAAAAAAPGAASGAAGP